MLPVPGKILLLAREVQLSILRVLFLSAYLRVEPVPKWQRRFIASVSRYSNISTVPALLTNYCTTGDQSFHSYRNNYAFNFFFFYVHPIVIMKEQREQPARP